MSRDRDERVLQAGRDDGEVLGVLARRSLSRPAHPRHPSRSRLDLGAAGGELLLEPLVAAVEVVDAVDDRLALGGEPGEDQR